MNDEPKTEQNVKGHDPLSLSGLGRGVAGAAIVGASPTIFGKVVDYGILPATEYIHDKIDSRYADNAPKLVPDDYVPYKYTAMGTDFSENIPWRGKIFPSAAAISYLAGNKMTEDQRNLLAAAASLPMVPQSVGVMVDSARLLSTAARNGGLNGALRALPSTAAYGLMGLSAAAVPYLAIKGFNKVVHGDDFF